MANLIDYIIPIAILFFQSSLVLLAVLLMAYFGIYGERKIWAAVQLRRGPNVVGPFGLLQSAADLMKLLFSAILTFIGKIRVNAINKRIKINFMI